MNKEKLLKRKREIVNEFTFPFDNEFIITDEQLKYFSINQLRILATICNHGMEYSEKCNPFYTLSATEVIQKSTGRIASFEDNGNVIEVNEKDILSGASSGVYKSYIERNMEGK